MRLRIGVLRKYWESTEVENLISLVPEWHLYFQLFYGESNVYPRVPKRTSSHLDFVNVVPDGSFQTQSGFISHPQKLEPIGFQDSWDLLCDGAKWWGFPVTLFTIGFVLSFFPKKKKKKTFIWSPLHFISLKQVLLTSHLMKFKAILQFEISLTILEMVV